MIYHSPFQTGLFEPQKLKGLILCLFLIILHFSCMKLNHDGLSVIIVHLISFPLLWKYKMTMKAQWYGIIFRVISNFYNQSTVNKSNFIEKRWRIKNKSTVVFIVAISISKIYNCSQGHWASWKSHLTPASRVNIFFKIISTIKNKKDLGCSEHTLIFINSCGGGG